MFATSLGPPAGVMTDGADSEASEEPILSTGATDGSDGMASATGGSSGGSDGTSSGESSTGGTASTGSTQPPIDACEAAEGDDECVTCIRSSCCMQLEVCLTSDVCSCAYDCLLMGLELSTCALACGLDDQVTAVALCGVTSCEVAC